MKRLWENWLKSHNGHLHGMLKSYDNQTESQDLSVRILVKNAQKLVRTRSRTTNKTHTQTHKVKIMGWIKISWSKNTSQNGERRCLEGGGKGRWNDENGLGEDEWSVEYWPNLWQKPKNGEGKVIVVDRQLGKPGFS